MLYVTEFLQSAASRGGVRPPVVGTTAQPYTADRPTPPRLALVFQRGYLLCSGVICNPPERRARQLRWIIQRNGVAVAVLARGEPSAELPAARVRRTAADYASTCKSASVCPSMAFSGVRLIRERVGILVL